MALTDLTRISTSGIATGTSLSGAILHGDAHFRGTQVGVTSALFDSSDNALEFNDNVKIKLGNSGDLEVYHDGANSYIQESGTGQLKILSTGLSVRNAGDNKQMALFTANSSVALYDNGFKKFETTNKGAVVTGILTASKFSGSLVGNTSNASGISTFYDLRVSNNLTVEGTTTTLDTNLVGVDRVEVGANSNSIVGVAVTQSGTADIVRLFDGASQVVTVDDTGNVGIGSAIPAKKLDIAGDIKLDNGPILSQDSGNSGALKIVADGGYIDVGPKNSNFCHLQTNVPAFFIGKKIVVSGEVASWNSDLILATNSSSAPYAATERMRLKTNGRVEIPGGPLLIGTTTAGYSTADDLTIATSGSTGITLRSGTSSEGTLYFADGTGGTSQYSGIIAYNHGDNSMRFATNDGTEKLRITSGGNVGIGSDIPTQKLDVNGIIAASQGLRVPNGSDSTNYISVGNGGGLRLWGTSHQFADIRAGNLHFRNTSLQNILELQQDKDIFLYGPSYFLDTARFDSTVNIADSIIHHGDTDTKIRFPSADTISFETAGNERLRIASDGTSHFYGNQTSAPEGDFGFRWDRNSSVDFCIKNTNNTSVNAGARIKLIANIGNIAMHYVNNGGFYLNNSASGYLHYYTNGTSRLYIDTSGNVTINNAGTIGTSNGGVGKRFGIKSTANNIIIGETTSASNLGIILESRQTGRSGGARCSQIEMGDGVISLLTAASGADVTQRLRITSDGNIAINGAAPNHDASSGSIFIKAPSGNPNRGVKWSDTSDTHYVKYESSVIDGLTINGYSGVAFATGSRTNSTWAERLRINSSGRVGINTTTDSMDGVTGNLNIANTNFNNHTVINLSRNTAADRAYIRFSNTNGNIASIGCFASDFVIYAANDLILGPSNTEKLRITSAGLLLGGSDASNNTTLGGNAGDSIASGGISNTLIGKDAGTAISTGDSHAALGYLALKTISTNSGCVAVGSNALELTTGSDNCAVGFAAGQQVVGGTNNCLFGSSAGLQVTDGDYNVAIGRDALRLGSGTGCNNNTVIGSYSLNQLTNPYHNIVIGYNSSGSGTMTGSGTWHSNIVIGYQAGNNKPTAASNIVIGKYACNEAGQSQSDNIIMGVNACRYLGNSSNNLIAIGQEAGFKAGYTSSSNHGQSWTHSVAIGYRAMYNATGAPDSVVAIGSNALKEHDGDGDNTSGGYIVSVGNNSMAANQHIRHTVAVGNDAAAYWNAAKGNQHEGGCVFIGGGAGRYQGTASAIIAIGRDSLNASSATPASGTNNTAIGARCLEKVSTGSHNVAVSALYGALFVSTGSWNTFMGSLAGYAYDTNNCCKTGNYCVQIGAYTRSSGSSNDYENCFGYGMVGKGANTTHIRGNAYNSNNSSSWSTTSDERIKKNIVDNNIGLDAIEKIRVRNFEYRTQNEITDFDDPKSVVVQKEGVQLGVIAQEIKDVLPDVVNQNTTGAYSVDPDNLTWYLVNAVKELSAEVKSLKAQLNS